MSDLKGQEVSVLVDGNKIISGLCLSDAEDKIFLIIKKEDGRVFRVVKSKITAFIESGGKPLNARNRTDVNLNVIRCINEQEGCQGVRFIIDGDPTPEKIKPFLDVCQCRNSTCSCKMMGNLFMLKHKILIDMLSGVVLGNYPEE